MQDVRMQSIRIQCRLRCRIESVASHSVQLRMWLRIMPRPCNGHGYPVPYHTVRVSRTVLACTGDRVGHRLGELIGRQSVSACAPTGLGYGCAGAVYGTAHSVHTQINETLIRYHAACAPERLPGLGSPNRSMWPVQEGRGQWRLSGPYLYVVSYLPRWFLGIHRLLSIVRLCQPAPPPSGVQRSDGVLQSNRVIL